MQHFDLMRFEQKRQSYKLMTPGAKRVWRRKSAKKARQQYRRELRSL